MIYSSCVVVYTPFLSTPPPSPPPPPHSTLYSTYIRSTYLNLASIKYPAPIPLSWTSVPVISTTCSRAPFPFPLVGAAGFFLFRFSSSSPFLSYFSLPLPSIISIPRASSWLSSSSSSVSGKTALHSFSSPPPPLPSQRPFSLSSGISPSLGPLFRSEMRI